MIGASSIDRRNAAMDAVAQLRKEHPSRTDVQRLFTARLADEKFREIGSLVLSNRVLDRLDDHVIVWTGFELASDSKRFDWS